MADTLDWNRTYLFIKSKLCLWLTHSTHAQTAIAQVKDAIFYDAVTAAKFFVPALRAVVRISASEAWLWIRARKLSSVTSSSKMPVRPW